MLIPNDIPEIDTSPTPEAIAAAEAFQELLDASDCALCDGTGTSNEDDSLPCECQA